MRLLITGSTQHWAIETYYQKYLAEHFQACEIFNSAERFFSYLGGNYMQKALFKMGLSNIFKKINHDLLEYTLVYKPDVILVFKGMELLPETLLELKKRGIKLLNYNPDHPFIRTFRSSGGENVETCVPLYDVHFSYSLDLMNEINKRFGIDTVWLPFGFELEPAFFNQLEKEPEVVKVCFAGNPDSNRAAFLQQLADAGIPLDVYGHDWHKFLRSTTEIKVHDAVYANEFWKVLRRYRVQLNLFRPHNAGSHNMRSFEVPAAGGIMLAPDTKEHRLFFEEGQEVFLYNNTEDCALVLKELLAKKTEECNEIRHSARIRSINEDYSYRRRASDVYAKISQL